MKQKLIIFTLAIAGGMLGANVQPILSGAGKLIFPEASPAANLSASSGALTVAAGGSNKDVILTPSGTGMVSITGTNANLNAAGMIRSSGFTSTTPLTGAGLELLYASGGIVQAYDRTASSFQPLSLSGSTIALNGPVTVTGGGNLDVSGIYKKGGTAGVGGAISVTLTTQDLHYKDWGGANAALTVVTNVTITGNNFSGGIRIL